jgi:hypothetical protein
MDLTSTSEKPVSKKRDEIVKEARRIEEGALYTSKAHFAAAEIWRAAHLGLGLLTVVLATIVGARALVKIDADGSIASLISIAVAILSAVTTFLNPNKKAADHLSAGNKLDALMNKVRIFWTLDCWADTAAEHSLLAKLKTYSEEKSELNKVSPPLFWLVYRIAKWGIQSGQAQYSVDSKPASGAPSPSKPPALPTDKPQG